MAGEPAPKRLGHGGEVVGALHRLDPEVPVVTGTGPAVLEDDHRAHRVGAHGVADVVALDPARRAVQVETGGEVGEQRLGPLRLEVLDDPALAQRGEGRLARPLHQPAQLAPLRDPNVDRTATLAGEEVGDVDEVLGGVRDDDGPGKLGRPAVELGEEGTQALGRRAVGDTLDLVGLRADHPAAADGEHRRHPPPRLDDDGDGVVVAAPATQDILPLADPVDGPETIAEARRQLVVEGPRRLLHLLAQLIGEHRTPALHEGLDLLQEMGVPGLVDPPLAGPAAAPDVVVEADPAPPEDLVAAGAEGEDGAQRADRGAE